MADFQTVSDTDLLKATLFNRCRLAESGCWIWVAKAKDSGGYGLFYLDGKNKKAHRVSYELFNGPIPEGMHILHSCDTPACVNPAHLRAGTVQENMAERDARGRRNVRGSQIGTSKLEAIDVLEIRASNLSDVELAEKYGVDKSNIWMVRTGKTWKHLPLTGVRYGY